MGGLVSLTVCIRSGRLRDLGLRRPVAAQVAAQVAGATDPTRMFNHTPSSRWGVFRQSDEDPVTTGQLDTETLRGRPA